MTRVVIVRERCASEDPPTGQRVVWTDQGPGHYNERLSRWGGNDLVGQPRVWFDFPRDTERATLTTGHIRVLAEAAEYVAAEHDSGAGEDDLLVQAAARLRAALDALER